MKSTIVAVTLSNQARQFIIDTCYQCNGSGVADLIDIGVGMMEVPCGCREPSEKEVEETSKSLKKVADQARDAALEDVLLMLHGLDREQWPRDEALERARAEVENMRSKP